MKTSIIICSRNRFKLLMERSLPSAMNQTATDFEIIIIDDCSDEEYVVPNKVRNDYGYVVPITYIRNLEHRGLAWSKNLGADYSRSEYVVFLDDDNEFLPSFLKQTVEYLDVHPEDAVAVGRIIVYPEGEAYQSPVVDGSINDGFLMRRREFLDIRCDQELTANDDADFGIRFHKKYKVGAIHEFLMRVWASPIFNTTSYSNYEDYHLDGLCRFWLKHHSPDYRKYIGRMFLLAAGQPKWFKWLYWVETKMKRYWQIIRTNDNR